MYKENKVIVFDLDGTVCEVSKFCTALVRSEPKNWTAFKMHIPHDEPIPQTVKLWKMFQKNGDVIIISTARDAGCKDASVEWLNRHNLEYDEMFMREEGFRGDDVIVKLENIKKIEEKYGKVDMIFDDRKKVCRAYSKAGYFVFDVGQDEGDF